MAQQKKKGGFFQRLIVGTEKAEGYARSTLPSNRWELGWDIFKGRFWKIVLINLMLVVGAAGVIVFLFMNYANNLAAGSTLPFGQNVGFGYPILVGLDQYALQLQIRLSNTTFMMLVPSLLLLGVVFSGVFYIMRNLVWTEGVFLANDFWRGLKQNIVQVLLVMLVYSLFLWMSSFSLNQIAWLEFNGQGNFFFSFSRVGIYIVMGLLTIMTLYCLTLSVTYQLKFFQLVKNAFLLTIGLLPQNIFFVFLMICPVILGLIFTPLFSFIIVIYLIFGMAAAVLIWTNYSHWVFDKFINERVEGAEKNRGIYQKVDVKGTPVAKKKKTFANPRKKKKSETPEPEITELNTNFSRADLERLNREKKAFAEAVEQQIADESVPDEPDEEETDEEGFDAEGTIENAVAEFGSDDEGSEGFEDALKIEGAEDEEPSEDEESSDETEDISDNDESDESEDSEKVKVHEAPAPKKKKDKDRSKWL